MKMVFAMMILVMATSAAQANGQALSTLTNGQLVKVTGKNLLRVGAACPISNGSIVLAAVGETFPVLSSLASMAVQIKTDDDERPLLVTDKTLASYAFGSVGAAVGDLGVIAYSLIFDDTFASDEMFRNSKTSYSATVALAKHFYGYEGECGVAGRTLIDVISEVNRRKSN